MSGDSPDIGHRRRQQGSPVVRIVLVMLVFLCVVFALIAIILAVKISNAASNAVQSPSPSQFPKMSTADGNNGLLGNGQRIALLDRVYPGEQQQQVVMACGNQACLDLALYLHKTVNKSVAACDHFYDYACGTWPVNDRTTSNSLLGQVMQSIDTEVQTVLERVLALPHGQRTQGRDVAQQQVVNFYDACTNVTSREKLGTKPLVDLLDDALSPCFLFGASDLADWDPIEAWKRTFRDFGVEAIFSIHVQVPPETEGPVWIVIAPKSPQLGSLVDSKDGIDRARDVLFAIGRKLSASAGVSRSLGDPFDYGVATFVEDALAMTQLLAAHGKQGQYPLVTMRAAEFASAFGLSSALGQHLFNPTNYFEEFFANVSALSVTVPINVDAGIQPFLRQLGRYLEQHKATWKRRFNNYLATEVILHYMLELSGDFERHLAAFFPKSYNRFYSKSYSVETRCRNEAEFTFKDVVYEMLVDKRFYETGFRPRSFKPADLPVRVSRDMFVSAIRSSRILNVAQVKVLSSKLMTARVVNRSDADELGQRYARLGMSPTSHFANVVALQRMRYLKLLRLLTAREGPGDRWDHFLRSTSFAAYAGDRQKAFYLNALLYRQPLFDADWPAEFNIARSAGVHYQLLKSMMLPYLKKETNSTLFRNYRSAIWCYQAALAKARFPSPVAQAVNFGLLFNSVNTSLRFLASDGAALKDTVLDYAIPGSMIRPPQLTLVLAAQPFCRKDISLEQRLLVHTVFSSLPDFSRHFHCPSRTDASRHVDTCPSIP